MNNETTYNGWTNYNTWRIALELFPASTYPYEAEMTADECREYAELILLEDIKDDLAANIICQFLDQVNWKEICDHLEMDQ